MYPDDKGYVKVNSDTNLNNVSYIVYYPFKEYSSNKNYLLIFLESTVLHFQLF